MSKKFKYKWINELEKEFSYGKLDKIIEKIELNDSQITGLYLGNLDDNDQVLTSDEWLQLGSAFGKNSFIKQLNLYPFLLCFIYILFL